jgi:hypothetical protein
MHRGNPHDRNPGCVRPPDIKQALRFLQPIGLDEALSKVNSIRSCCARLPPMRSFWPASGAIASIAGKILPLERRKAARKGRKVRARGVTPLARQFLHLPGTDIDRGIIPHDRLGQDDVQVGEPVAWPRQCAVRVIWAKNNFAIGRGHYHCKHEPCWYVVN